MRCHRCSRTVAAVTLVAVAASCATTRIPPISATGPAFEPARDEVRLWERARAEEDKLRKKALIYDDPLLEDYLEDTVRRLNPPAMANNPVVDYRVTVLEDPTLNAFAYPHGSLYVHTGLLARLENEDQLATVLGHEMSHVEDRHMLRHTRSARNKQIGFSIAAIAGAVVLAGETGEAIEKGDYGRAARIDVLTDVLIGLGLQLAFIAAVNGFGRGLEREADMGGFRKMLDAGYDVTQAPAVYEALMQDHGDAGKVEVFFFGSHPKLANRLESAREFIEAHAGEVSERPPRSEEFTRRIRPVIRDDARLNIERGRLDLAEVELEKAIRWLPTDPVAHALMGRLKLERADSEKDPAAKRDFQEQARRSLREAVRLDPELPGPHRELGLLAYHEGDYAAACAEFARYVELAPDAGDTRRIKDYLLELRQSGRCP